MADDKMDEKAIFNVARQINSPDARREYLRHVCGTDNALLARLETLLQAYAEQSSFLETPPAPDISLTSGVSPTIGLPLIEKAGTLIGPYKLLQQIGQGGMGVVYMAEQSKPIARMVALKIIKPGMDTQQVVARFEAERQALAMMDHPNIAKVLDAGTTESGRPYFVMELVKGVPITNYCDDHHLTPKQRLELFVQVLHAVQHAHQKGIIHRDIKPSNVLVAEYDQQAVPKVIDFGVAKATSQKLTDKTMFTHFGQLIGTLEYMSPEQAKLNQMDIDTRCDIYSLGVLLYELLTGDTPFDRKRLRSAAFEEMMRIIREEEPPIPSTRLSSSGMLASVSANRSTEPRKLSNFMRGELDWIVMRAMEKERSRRYDTPNAFAEDIQRFLNQEAVVARPVSTAYRMKKFAQRNWGAVIAGSVIAAALLIGLGTSTWFAIRENRAAAEADRQREIALSAKDEAERQRTAAESAATEEIKQREIAQKSATEAIAAREAEAVERAAAVKERDRVSALNLEIEKQAEQQRRMRYASDMNLIQSAWDADNVGRVLELLNVHRPEPGQNDLRGFEWHYWNRQCHSDLLTVKLPENSSLTQAAFSPDGSRLAGVFSEENGTLARLRGLSTAPVAERSLFSVDLGNSIVSSMAWHPDGTHLAVSSFDESSRAIRIYDINSSKTLFTIHEPMRVARNPGQLSQSELWFRRSEFWFSEDCSRIATAVDGQPHRKVKFWDAVSGEELASIPLPDTYVSNVWISPDGSNIAYSSSTDGTESTLSVKIMDVSLPERSVTLPITGLVSYRFSPDSKRLFVSGIAKGSSNKTQEIGGGVFDVKSGDKIFSLPVGSRWSLSKFSPDGKWFAACTLDRPQTVSLISTSGDCDPMELRGHTVRQVALGFSPDSQQLYTAGSDFVSGDSRIKTWDIATVVQSEISRPKVVTRSSELIAAESLDGKLNACAPRTVHSGPITRSNIQHDTRKNVITVSDESRNVLHQSAELVGPVQWITFSSDGRRLVACALVPDGDLQRAAQLIVLDAASGVERLNLRLPVNERQLNVGKRLEISHFVPEGLLSPDGQRVAALINVGSGNLKTSYIKVWEIDSNREIWQSEAVSEFFHQMMMSPDGERIVAVTESQRKLNVWDSKDGKMLWSAMDKVGIDGLSFSADGKLVFGLAASNRVIKLWENDSGRELKQFSVSEWQSGSKPRVALALSPNNRRLAAMVGQASGVKVWDVDRPESELFALPLQNDPLKRVAVVFSPDNRRIATCTRSLSSSKESEGQTKIWDAETGNELLTLLGAASNPEFNSTGTILTCEMVNTSLREIYVRRSDARPLAPQVEAEQMIEAFTDLRSAQTLPLLSEILDRIDADLALPKETRAAAVSNAKALRREKEFNDAAYTIVALQDQPPQKYERALRYLEEACLIDPNNQESWSIRGLAHFRLRQSTEALAALARSRELHANKKLSQSADDCLTLAMIQFEAGQREESNKALEQVRTSVSRCEGNWQNSSRFARDVKAWTKLLSEAETLVGIPKAADNPTRWIGKAVMPRLYATVEDKNGDDTFPYLPYIIDRVEGDRLWFGKNSIARSQVVPLEDAERYYTRLLESNPQSATTHNYLGIMCRATGDYDKAIEYYSTAIRLTPTQYVYLYNRGNIWHKDKRAFDKALVDYDEALRLKPTEALLHTLRGILRREQGDPEDALKSFDQAILLQPDQGRAYAHRAGIWSVKGDKVKMQQDLDDAIRHSPDSPGTLAARAWLMATSPNAEHRNGNQAVKEATRACEQFIGDADLYRLYDTLAAAFAETGDFEQAITFQEKALALAPPAWRTEFESRKKLYLERKPYRDPLLIMPVVTGP